MLHIFAKKNLLKLFDLLKRAARDIREENHDEMTSNYLVLTSQGFVIRAESKKNKYRWG